MQFLEHVYQNYQVTRARGGFVPWANETGDLVAVRVALPEMFARLLAGSRRNTSDFKIYGRVGEPNRSFAKIPWVAICDLRVSNSTTRGYYIVLLFHEDMRGCFLSLNQGFTQFEKAYPTAALALYQVEASARRCLGFLERRPDFVAGRIDLGATRPLGQGYERGAILSRWYPRDTEVNEDALGADFEYLLVQYERLIASIGPSLTLDLAAPSEAAFQEAVSKLARSKKKSPPPPSGPVPVPPPVPGSKSTRYARDPNVCARVLEAAGYCCDVNSAHLTFICQKSRENFVEAHHLIPMSLQREFTFSLDVDENVVALCPTCHRLLHHGRRGLKRPILSKLLDRRKDGLRGRKIEIDLDHLLNTYSELEEEE